MEPLLRPARAVDATANHLRTAILRGELPAGERMPAERDLAVTLGINRLTLRAAMTRLEAEGLLTIRHGDGAHVRAFRENAGLDLLRHLTLDDHVDWVRGFLELRRAVAAEAVALACAHAHKKDLEALEKLAAQQAAEEDAKVFGERDLAFGRAVLRMAGNLAFELLLNNVEGVYRAHPRVMDALHQDRDVIRASYYAVVELVRAGDADAARSTVRQSLELIDAKALRRLSRRGAGNRS